MKRQGFTLIELLVVIAIIGILSSVVLASLNTARSKGSDAAIKSQIGQLPAQAAIFYDNNSITGYEGLCSDTTFKKLLTAAATSSTGEAGRCLADANGWAAAAALKSNTSVFWCVDSEGSVGSTTSASAAVSSTTCGL